MNRPIPKDGTLIRMKLSDGTLAAGFWVPSPGYWNVMTAKTTLQFSDATEAEWITSWAPFARGSWSPYWSDLSDELDDVNEVPQERWWVWNKFGHPPRFAWQTEEGAVEEAKRLARAMVGYSFIVMHSVRKFRVGPDIGAVSRVLRERGFNDPGVAGVAARESLARQIIEKAPTLEDALAAAAAWSPPDG